MRIRKFLRPHEEPRHRILQRHHIFFFPLNFLLSWSALPRTLQGMGQSFLYESVFLSRPLQNGFPDYFKMSSKPMAGAKKEEAYGLLPFCNPPQSSDGQGVFGLSFFNV
jgi:hypothetical protein